MNADELDPGIRDVVIALWAAGFKTTDSGDGVSRVGTEMDSENLVIPWPHVVCEVEPHMMVTEARRASEVMTELGYAMGPQGRGPSVTASFDPGDESAILFIEIEDGP
ncbi:MAG: hypothetical protein ABL912_01660 [Novosphingobium sp.]